jgi:carboxypeptidase C (cathepsin A)
MRTALSIRAASVSPGTFGGGSGFIWSHHTAVSGYHGRVQPPALETFLREVESFALGEYSTALLAGSLLPETRQRAIAEKLNGHTGLPVDYSLKANLRVEGGVFSKNLQDADGITTGRMDTRYRGPDLNRLSEDAEYDPSETGISAPFTSAINHYLRTELKYGKDQTYKPNAYSETDKVWDFRHKAPGGPRRSPENRPTMISAKPANGVDPEQQ